MGTNKRLLLVGAGSFIGGHVGEAARKAGMEVQAVFHDAPLETIERADYVLNCAIHPRFWTEGYVDAHDFDLRGARVARRLGARFIMLSTRRVYSAAARWDALEGSEAVGDETAYGRNKALSEQAVLQEVPGNSLIFRLSNIFGFEYNPDRPRKNFFAQALHSLRESGEIRFDMSPDTRRDFLPVEVCAAAIVEGMLGGPAGVFNQGCGFPVTCGEVAQWVIEGYGRGRLVVTRDEVRDEFFLNMGKWRGLFPSAMSKAALQETCRALGRRLNA